MMLCAYARFVVRRSYLILFIVGVISTVLTVIPLVCHELPSFADPIVGFETRGTTLAHRFIAWENLIDETRPSRRLAVDPKEIEDQIRMNHTYNNRPRQHRTRSGKKGKNKNRHKNKKNLYNSNSTGYEKTLFVPSSKNVSSNHVHWGYGKNVPFEDEELELLRNHTRKQWASLRELQREPDKLFHPNYASGTCGPPMIDYAHLVVTTLDNTSLLSFGNIQKLCQLQALLVDMGKVEYHNMCQRTSSSEELCCPMWSVPNYIALLSGKLSCENLTRQDVDNTVVILKKCAPYFYNFTLMASCDFDQCNVPKYCSEYNGVYNLLFYLIDADSFANPNSSQIFVKNVMLFFPLPRSSTVLPYYKIIESTNTFFETLYIPAIDFGLKNTLFDLWVIQDTWLVALGGVFVFLGVWVYTKSVILTILLFIAITYSLGIAYFLYIYVFNLDFFPFMNLLVIVVVIGIGADDAFLYVKIWKMVSQQLIKDNVVNQDNDLGDIKNMSSAGETILVQILEETIRHSATTMFITSLTTAVAFFASYVSYIPAINCFSTFAGTAVLVNFLLMVSWLPASVFVIDVKMNRNNKKTRLKVLQTSLTETWDELRLFLNRFVVTCVCKFHILFIIVLGSVGIGSIVVVFYNPGLQLPESRQFQLFQTDHPFEQYDMNYQDKFLFERFGKDIGTGSKMPLRWVWGIDAIDNGNHMNPASTGKLIFNDKFSISDPQSQLWLLNFCAKIKAQPFYQQQLGPLLPNCFIESFKMYMSRRCIDKIDKIDRTPCCETSRFPYKKEVFDFCIIKAIESLYQTPHELFIPGVAGPKFLRMSPPKIAAIVVEFESVVPYSMSFTSMDKFFSHVENWTQNELLSAPPGLQDGWFLSDFQFYDLQKTLASGTVIALMLSAVLGFIVLLPATLSFMISVCALSAIVFSSTVTIAILVLCGWKLNVLESVAISTSAGLAVDFSLHYVLSYTNAPGTKLSRIKYALSASFGPTAAAAITTGFAGIFLLRSNILPYSQIGTFLALVMSISWIYATFFLCSLLFIFGRNSSKDSPVEERKSVSRVSSVCSGIQNLESHELEHLADSNRTNLNPSHSPSGASATTVVLHDDSEVSIGRGDKDISFTGNVAACEND